ncbi:hypothetical protein HYALB_00001023 [Hymenoscyphus albidus]|uniref:Uncharacterized protein n=1 Tax=Hymenoscyphus albidus TaxID=595503 RepID=A0A9N9QCQ0_9HELO|nr:hypothetical protein HYALB_00001023 [Hymenoscyphus albidus]
MAIMSTLGGWVAVVAVGGGFWYYHRSKAPRPAAKQRSKPIEAREKQKEKKSNKDGGLSNGGDQPSKKSQKKKTPPAPKPVREEKEKPVTNVPISKERDDEVDNKEFARQFSSIQAGHVMSGKSQVPTKQKSVKQSKAQEKAGKTQEKVAPVEASSDNATAPSSATGGDADDDQSSVNSPELKATAVETPASNGVSDMLEQPSAGPSVLKITEPANPTMAKKKKQPAAFEAVETKKQRQNRKKAEAAKLAREEDEKERKALMEKQRRTAREAEGRAAKDGSAFMASKAPVESAWVAPTNGTLSNDSKSAEKVQLLDTYEPTSTKPAKPAFKPGDSNYSESELAGSDWQKNYSSLPSEEEQERIAIEESDEWQTVKAKERRKAEKKVPAKVENSSAKVEEPKFQDNYGPPPVIAPTPPGQKWVMTTVHVTPTGEVVEQERVYQDSEWEVA